MDGFAQVVAPDSGHACITEDDTRARVVEAALEEIQRGTYRPKAMAICVALGLHRSTIVSRFGGVGGLYRHLAETCWQEIAQRAGLGYLSEAEQRRVVGLIMTGRPAREARS